MPLSESKRYARFNVGKMMKARKDQRNKVAMAHISLQENNRKLDSMGVKKRRLEDKIVEMKENIQSLSNEHQVLNQNPSAVVNRQNSPTCDDHGNNLRCNRTMNKRRSETFNSALRIHGGTSTNTLPAISGLVDTLAVKGSKGELTSVISRKRKLCNQVFPQIYNSSVKKFEDSQENLLRSISTYFTRGVIGKRKYRSLYRVLSMKKAKRKGKKLERIKIMSCKVARLLPYNKMIAA
ncbi:uncharacterized protein LOC116309082, partial [Actinia tenebrosa]|uniref:Uncharacterized protein LOC116309082 n=1 Tax=Actinia tenebrosa TaxID=6105 RepID=A0A6P8J5U5_ACTTE